MQLDAREFSEKQATVTMFTENAAKLDPQITLVSPGDIFPFCFHPLSIGHGEVCSIPSNRLKQSGVQEAMSVRRCLFTGGPVQAGSVTRPEQPFIYSFRPPLGSLCSSPS